MGSGTTAVVSKELNRDFIGFEINKEHCELIKNRMKDFTNSGDGEGK